MKTEKMKIYISGKITGLPPEEVKEKFARAEKFLLDQGMSPVNPLKLKTQHCKEWCDFMRVDIVAMMDCNAIFLLEDWKYSPGANLEVLLARKLNFFILHENESYYK